MSTVTVLSPGGRRQQVKVTPNTKILDIIEEVCKKQGLASNEYDLYHQKRALDITLTFRLTGCPNNAHFELKKLENGPRQFADVTIVLQIEDGSKLAAKTYKPDTTTLAQIIESYLAESDSLKKVLDEQEHQITNNYPCCVYLNEQVVGVYQMKNTSLKDLGLTDGRGIIRLLWRTLDRAQFETLNNEFKQKLEKKLKLDEQFKSKLKENEELEEKKSSLESSPMSVSECEAISVAKRQKFELMEFEQRDSSVSLVDMQVETTEINTTTTTIKQNEFADFKFPEETKGQTLNDLSEMAEFERLSKEPCERQLVAFSLEKEAATSGSKSDEEVPDEFFDLTVNDLRYMLADLKRVQHDEQPLKTKQMREYERDKQAMRYAKIVVRVCFKDRRVIQGLFRPKESVESLYAFVRSALCAEANGAEEMDFYLYSTPPKIILSDLKKSLFDSQLCPAALIYFKNKVDSVPKLATGVRLVSLNEANQIVEREVHRARRSFEDDASENDLVSKESTLTKNILKSTSYGKKAEPAGDYEGASGSSGQRVQKSEDNEFNRKLGRFLKGSKK